MLDAFSFTVATVTLQVALVPSFAVAMIFVVPPFLPVTFPFLFTVAIFLFSLDHLILCFGVTVAFNWMVFPFTTTALVFDNLTTVCSTVTLVFTLSEEIATALSP